MKALVVYESMYGNTAAVGEAIVTSLRAQGLEVKAGPISRIGPADAAGVDLLVVGGPTHGHGMSRASSRETAASDKDNTYAQPTVLGSPRRIDRGRRASRRHVTWGLLSGEPSV